MKEKITKVSNIILAISIFNILWFTIVAIVLQFKNSVELSGTLITCWYAFWTSEIFALAGIKITRIKNTEETEDGMVG